MMAESIGAFLSSLLLLLLVLFQVLIEGWITYLLKYQSLGKSFLHALVANAVSLTAIILLFKRFTPIWTTGNNPELIAILIFFGMTLVLESIVYYLFNRIKPIWTTLRTVGVINLATYIIYYLIFLLSVR